MVLPPPLPAAVVEGSEVRGRERKRARAEVAHAVGAWSSRWWEGVTAMPLLDLWPSTGHPTVAARLTGEATSVPDELHGVWVEAVRTLANAGGGQASRWRYERATDPVEVLLHVDGTERGTRQGRRPWGWPRAS